MNARSAINNVTWYAKLSKIFKTASIIGQCSLNNINEQACRFCHVNVFSFLKVLQIGGNYNYQIQYNIYEKRILLI
jgi:hypothetical protein